MPTPRQEKLAEAIIENSRREVPLSKGELLEKSGYSRMSAESVPGKLMDRRGVQEALAVRGFDPQSAKRVVSEILHNKESKDENRLRSADMIFRVAGVYAPDKVVSVSLSQDVTELVKLDDGKLSELLDRNPLD